MEAGFFGSVVSSQPTNGNETVTPEDRRYIEVIKLFGGVHKDIKELSASLKGIKENISDVQLELSVLKENISGKGLVKDGVTKSVRLPKVLTSSVKKLHVSLENQFDGSKLYSDSYNQEVAAGLMSQLEGEFGADYDRSIIQRAVYRHFESRRRIHVDSQPARENAKQLNERKTKLRSRQKQLYERRLKLCRKKEVHFWSQIDEKFMTEEESDENDATILYQHKPHWRSENLNKFITKLQKRDRHLKKKKRVSSTLSFSAVPENAPTWAVTSVSVTPSQDNTNSAAELETEYSINAEVMPEPGLTEDARMSSEITSEQDLLARVLYERSPVVNIVSNTPPNTSESQTSPVSSFVSTPLLVNTPLASNPQGTTHVSTSTASIPCVNISTSCPTTPRVSINTSCASIPRVNTNISASTSCTSTSACRVSTLRSHNKAKKSDSTATPVRRVSTNPVAILQLLESSSSSDEN